MNIFIEKFPLIGYITIYYENDFIKRVKFGKDFHNGIESKPNKIVELFCEQVQEYVKGKNITFKIPYKLDCPMFFEKVYDNLAKIPFGETVSYKKLALLSGNGKAYRAVGNACKYNPLPLIIPCHRVIKSNGEIGDFAGGKNLKKILLSLENEIY